MTDKYDKITTKHAEGTRDRLRKAGKKYPNINGTPSMSNAVRKYIEDGLKRDGIK